MDVDFLALAQLSTGKAAGQANAKPDPNDGNAAEEQ